MQMCPLQPRWDLGFPCFCMLVCLGMLSGLASKLAHQSVVCTSHCMHNREAFEPFRTAAQMGPMALPARVFLVCWGVVPGSVCTLAHQSALHQFVTAQGAVRHGTQNAGHPFSLVTEFQCCFGSSWRYG